MRMTGCPKLCPNACQLRCLVLIVEVIQPKKASSLLVSFLSRSTCLKGSQSVLGGAEVSLAVLQIKKVVIKKTRGKRKREAAILREKYARDHSYA